MTDIEIIQTNALDQLNDTITFWYSPTEEIISDDGWTYHKVYEETYEETAATEELAKKCCEKFYCEFNTKEKEFIYRLDDGKSKETGVTLLIQAITVSNTIYFK